MKLKKNIPLIDQHDKNGFYGNRKFGGNFVAETARKPIEDLSKLFEKLRRSKKFLKKRDYYFKHYFAKLYNHCCLKTAWYDKNTYLRQILDDKQD